MGTARIAEGYWLCGKRWKLEAAVAKAGHAFPTTYRERRPMTAAEHGALVLAFLDSRDDPEGHFDGRTKENIAEVEDAAHWTGKPGVLWNALVESGWIDVPHSGRPRWHDYGSWNRLTITARVNGRSGGRPREAGSVRDRRGAYDETRDETGTEPKTEPMTKPKGGEVTKRSGSGSGALTGTGNATRAERARANGVVNEETNTETLALRLEDVIGCTLKEARKAVRGVLAAGASTPWVMARVGFATGTSPKPWEWATAAKDAWAVESGKVPRPAPAPAACACGGVAQRGTSLCASCLMKASIARSVL